jgi:hypothetical protein
MLTHDSLQRLLFVAQMLEQVLGENGRQDALQEQALLRAQASQRQLPTAANWL